MPAVVAGEPVGAGEVKVAEGVIGEPVPAGLAPRVEPVRRCFGGGGFKSSTRIAFFVAAAENWSGLIGGLPPCACPDADGRREAAACDLTNCQHRWN